MMHPQHADQQLDQLAEAFAHWRQCRTTPREGIPGSLWEQAVALTQVLPISRVAKRLGLGTTDLKKRCARHTNSLAPPKPLTTEHFLEVPPPPSWLSATVDIAIHRGDGTHMRISCPPHEASLATVVRAFVEAHACCN